jgi:hypothetical protein
MAERKGPKMVSPLGRQSGKEMSEKSPKPHGESNILEMPIRTQQRNETTGKNIPQVPNTIGGDLNPSVAHEFEKHVLSDRPASARRPRELNSRKGERSLPEDKAKDA